MTTPTLLPEIEAAIADAGQALVDAWDSAQDGPPHRFAVYTDPEGDPEVAAGWMAMACMHASALAAAREAGRREVLDVAKADVPTPPPEIEAAITAAAWSIAELDRRADVMAQPEIGALRTAITSALAAAREAGRRDVLEGAAGIDECACSSRQTSKQQ